jgi:ribonuclease HI
LKRISIYTDGACSENPGPGGWGLILIYRGHEKELSGSEENTTNNRMEMTAAIKGLEALKESCMVDIYSDSAYLVNAFNEKWIDNWANNSWMNSKKEEVANRDLWQKLLKLTLIHKVNWIKVKGHSDNEYNNRCDKLAVEEVKKLKKAKEDENGL